MPSEKNKSINWRGLANLASGDLLYYQNGNWVRLPAGSPGDILRAQGGAVLDYIWYWFIYKWNYINSNL